MTAETALFTDYKYGFVTDVETDALPKGLNEDVIRAISAKKEEPDFILEFRLKAYRKMAGIKGAALGKCQIPLDRLSKHYLLFRPQKKARSQ